MTIYAGGARIHRVVPHMYVCVCREVDGSTDHRPDFPRQTSACAGHTRSIRLLHKLIPELVNFQWVKSSSGSIELDEHWNCNTAFHFQACISLHRQCVIRNLPLVDLAFVSLAWIPISYLGRRRLAVAFRNVTPANPTNISTPRC